MVKPMETNSFDINNIWHESSLSGRVVRGHVINLKEERHFFLILVLVLVEEYLLLYRLMMLHKQFRLQWSALVLTICPCACPWEATLWPWT
jgi:hypothetical protein